jgi:class 3 adenylate cyclase/tetratricopeptide (TPR) repeat protein
MTPMLRCGRCGVDNPPGFRFCGGCGAALGTVDCASCGALVPAGQRFCGTCGAAMAVEVAAAEPAPAPVQGRVADASTGAAVVEPPPVPAQPISRADPAAPPERKLATILFADVVGFTGLAERSDHEAVARTVGDALARLVAVVDEHGGTVDKFLGDALMAVFGVPVSHDDDAERAVAAALAMRDAAGELAFSIGVNTGEVMVTQMPGDERPTVIGDAVNIAARLEKAAASGEVLVGPLTAELAGKAVVFRERGTTVLAGRREPVAVWEAMELRSASTAERAVPPLVGRDDELDFLVSRWRRSVRDRRAEAVLLIGEVGTGKSRLLDELGGRIDDATTIVRATYPAYGALSGARVVRQILERLGESDDPAIDARLRSLAGMQVPDLGTLDADTLEQEQLRAFRQHIEQHAARRPILVLLDEVQRASDRTLRFLSELVVRVEAPILLVLAGRPEPGDWLLRFTQTTRLRLEALGGAEAAELAAALVPEGRLTPQAAAVLAERGAGNPLHLRELVRLVRERDGLFGADGGLELRGDLALPPSLQAVLAARLDALPSTEKVILQHVAVLGDDASAEALAALGLADSEADLQRLAAAGLLRDREAGRIEIVDPLLRDVAYESMPRQSRAALHTRAAAVSGREDERARHLELALAHRPDDATLRAEAADAVAAAGLRLAALHRPRDAVALLRRSVELGHSRPGALLRLAQSLVEVGADEEALTVLDRIEGPMEPDEAAERIHVRANAESRRHPAVAVAMYGEAEKRWKELGNAVKEAWAVSNAAVALTLLGDLREASRVMTRALDLFSAIGDRIGMSAARQFLGILHPEDPRVEAWMEEGLAWARETGDSTRERYGIQSLMWHHFLRCFLGGEAEIAVALGHAEALARMSAGVGDQIGGAYGHGIAAILLRGAGDLDGCACHAQALRGLELEPGTGAAVLRDAAEHTADLIAAPDTPLPRSLLHHGDTAGLMGIVSAAVACLLAGRVADADAVNEVLARAAPDVPGIHVVKFGIVDALRRLIDGEADEAASRLVGVVSTSRAPASAAAGRALLAEALVRQGDVPAAQRLLADIGDSGGIAGLLVLRARAVAGEPGAASRLEAEAERLHAPGALLGLPASLASA